MGLIRGLPVCLPQKWQAANHTPHEVIQRAYKVVLNNTNPYTTGMHQWLQQQLRMHAAAKSLNGSKIFRLTGTKTAELWEKQKQRKQKYFRSKNHYPQQTDMLQPC